MRINTGGQSDMLNKNGKSESRETVQQHTKNKFCCILLTVKANSCVCDQLH